MRKSTELSVRRQCELLGITRSIVYYEARRPDETTALLKEEIMSRIDYWHTTMPYLGTRRNAVKLRGEGYSAGRKLVRAYMQEMGIHAVYPKINTSKRNFKEAVVPYLLRNKQIFAPNQVWSVDITYIKLHRGHMYLTAIIDWYSRKVMGWELSDTLDTRPVLAAVKNAVDKYGTPAIINSDQGSQFTSDDYKQLLRDLGIRQSMDGKSRWADNIMIERWFRSLKCESLYISEYKTPRELRQFVREYITEYNNVRPHEALEYRTPEEVYAGCFAVRVA